MNKIFIIIVAIMVSTTSFGAGWKPCPDDSCTAYRGNEPDIVESVGYVDSLQVVKSYVAFTLNNGTCFYSNRDVVLAYEDGIKLRKQLPRAVTAAQIEQAMNRGWVVEATGHGEYQYNQSLDCFLLFGYTVDNPLD